MAKSGWHPASISAEPLSYRPLAKTTIPHRSTLDASLKPPSARIALPPAKAFRHP